MTATWRGDAEELGASGAGLSRQGERNADAAGPGAVGQRDWREDADGAAAGCDARAGGEFLYEVRMRDSKKEELRRILFKEKHPLES